MKTRKSPLYVSVAILALTGVFAFGQEVPPAQANEQPAPAAVPAPAPAAEPVPAPTTEPVQPAAALEQPAPQPAPQPEAQPAQPALATEPPAPATETQQPPAATPAPANEPAQPAAAPAQPEPPAAKPAQPVQQVQAPAPNNEPPRETYIQGYGQPPQGFFGYYGYAPCEKKECDCASSVSAKAPEESEKDSEKDKKFKNLHSFHVSIPIESETYDFKKDHFKVDASHFGVGGNWNRIRIEEGLYSSVVGIGFNYIMSEWDGGGSKNLDYNGLDINLKFGFGVAPVREKFILAIHAFFGFDYKMLQAEFKEDMSNMFGDMDGIDMDFGSLGLDYKITHTMHSLDIVLGGDLIMAYQITDHFGVMAGIDISSNMIGGGVLLSKTEMSQGLSALANIGSYDDHGDYDDYDDFKDGGDDEISPILYFVSGINIVPRIGIFVTF